LTLYAVHRATGYCSIVPLATETAMGALSNFAHIAQGISLNMKVETAFNYGACGAKENSCFGRFS
jgi:hypothetical protein